MVPDGQKGVDKWAEWTDGCIDDTKIYTSDFVGGLQTGEIQRQY